MEAGLLLSTVVTGLVGFLLIFKFYFMKAAKCMSTARLDGKTVIITGANTGIGKETAQDLAKRGARVILACRDVKKAEEAAFCIAECVPGASLIVKHLDLASLTSVRQFAEDICKTEQSVDILVNNAAVCGIPYTKSEDGFEMTLAVNHLGHFLLTNLLLPKLKSSAPSRIINVAAHAHIFFNMDFQDLMLERNYSSVKAYCRSKLANVLFTRELSKRLRGTRVSVYAVHPGIVHTGIARHLTIMKIPVVSSVLNLLGRLLLKSPKQGCQTIVYCAVSEELVNESGMYYSNCALSIPTMTALHEGHAKLLWRVSSELVGLPPDQPDDVSDGDQGHEDEDDDDDDHGDSANSDYMDDTDGPLVF